MDKNCRIFDCPDFLGLDDRKVGYCLSSGLYALISVADPNGLKYYDLFDMNNKEALTAARDNLHVMSTTLYSHVGIRKVSEMMPDH